MRRGPRAAVIPNIDDATCWRTHICTSAKLFPPERDNGREGSRDAPSSRATTLAPACNSQRGSLLLWITGAVRGGEETVRNVAEDFAQSDECRRQQEERRRVRAYRTTLSPAVRFSPRGPYSHIQKILQYTGTGRFQNTASKT